MSDIYPDRRTLLSGIAIAGMGVGGSAQSNSNPVPADGVLDIERFGAVGDGRTDDSAAFSRALATIAPGGLLVLSAGRSYRLTRSLVFLRPLVVSGGAKENTRLLFDDGVYATLGGQKAAMIFPHEASAMGGTSRRTRLSGITVEWTGRRAADINGILAAAPVYCHEVDVRAFPLDGFHVEANTPRIRGNANGSSFINCSALVNGRNGFAFHGDDANACVLVGARAFDNRGAGFLDASLLGNTYVAGEVDGNLQGGFVSDKKLPNRSVYVGCYAEPNQKYDLNPRNMLIAPLGACDGNAPVMMRALPSGELFVSSGQVFAATEEAAVANARQKGGYLRVGPAGIDLMQPAGHRVRLAQVLSTDYVDLLNGDTPVLRLPASTVAGNISPTRPWLPQGAAMGASGRSGIVGAGDTPPTSGTFHTGALWLNDAPKAGGFAGWICIGSGTPGIWRAFGRIEP